MPNISVKYFASIREALGVSGETLHTSASNLGQLRTELAARGGNYAQALAPGNLVRMALNQTMAEPQAALSEDCEVAFFPPVTGG